MSDMDADDVEHQEEARTRPSTRPRVTHNRVFLTTAFSCLLRPSFGPPALVIWGRHDATGASREPLWSSTTPFAAARA